MKTQPLSRPSGLSEWRTLDPFGGQGADHISLVGGLLVVWPGPIQAHDIYKDLLNRSGLLCCHDGDCRPVPYRQTPKGVQMLVDEQWLDIPRGSIQYRILAGDRGQTGGGHWCGLRDAMGYFTRCAILPPQSAAIH